MSFYRRNLPHWQPDQAEYSVTFRLVDSLPVQALEQLTALKNELENTNKNQNEKQRRIFAKYEQLLDNATSGSNWLEEKAIAKIVTESMHYRDQTEYDLYAFCVMPNHVHLVFRLLNSLKDQKPVEFPVTNMLQELKRYTGVECNKILDRQGQFWQHESFDRVIRDKDELEKTIRYVLYNPVKAGLIDDWKEWAYTYCKPGFIKTFT